MPLLYPLVGRFVDNETAAISARHFLCLLFLRFKIAEIPLAVNLLIQRRQTRIQGTDGILSKCNDEYGNKIPGTQ